MNNSTRKLVVLYTCITIQKDTTTFSFLLKHSQKNINSHLAHYNPKIFHTYTHKIAVAPKKKQPSTYTTEKQADGVRYT